MNLSNDEINMFNQKIQTENSFNGHYSISISPDPTSNFDELEEVLIFQDNDTLESKQKKVKKLHFGHASSNNLIILLKNAKIYDKSLFQIVKNVTKEYDSCNPYKKPVSRPVVLLPRATSFNDDVAMDLHHLNESLWYLLMNFLVSVRVQPLETNIQTQ